MGVVHNAHAAPDVVVGMARVGAPGRHRQQVAAGRPGVDADVAVPEGTDGILQRRAQLLNGLGMNDELGAERSG